MKREHLDEATKIIAAASDCERSVYAIASLTNDIKMGRGKNSIIVSDAIRAACALSTEWCAPGDIVTLLEAVSVSLQRAQAAQSERLKALGVED